MALLATLSRTRIPIQIDMEFTDDILIPEEKINFPLLLSHLPQAKVKIYPLDFVIAEKYHAIGKLGEVNSRWKDFYDILIISENNNMEGMALQNAIQMTFRNRKTLIPEKSLLVYQKNFPKKNKSIGQYSYSKTN